jgi:hypothetical protein
MGALLALLLLLDGGEEAAKLGELAKAKLIKVDTLNVGALTEKQVGLAEVVLREALDQILDGGETLVDLGTLAGGEALRIVKRGGVADM